MTLYLKYRPRDFDSIVGQEFIKNTLSQAVIKDKLVGGYLFSGPRGTGKTSTARIFANAINCLNPINGNPCHKCEVCVGFANNSLADIIEIDARSNTGVDNIRDIIEKSSFAPMICKYKVYIIDEVHMLSKGAFNALLKILEEPPTHLKFILATTEDHKVLDTIKSRCQRYNFKSISNTDIKSRLEFIAKNEDIKVDSESLDFIVKESMGALRNAISLFQQLIINSEISFEQIKRHYGIPESERLFEFYNKLVSRDNSIISDIQKVNLDYNLELFIREFLFYVKDLLIKNIDDPSKLKTNISIIENLGQSFKDAKSSFDPESMYIVGVLKASHSLDNTPSHIINKSPEMPPILSRDINHTIDDSFNNTHDDMMISDDLGVDDILGVFGGYEAIEDHAGPDIRGDISNDKLPKNDIGNIEEISNVSFLNEEKQPKITSRFNKELFIDKLKDIGAKGALIVSIRAASIEFSDKDFIIHSKTKIGYKWISDATNVAMASEALDDMGYSDIQIIVK